MTFEISSWLIRQQQSALNLINIRKTLETYQDSLLKNTAFISSLLYISSISNNHHLSSLTEIFFYIFHHQSHISPLVSSPLPLQSFILLFSIITLHFCHHRNHYSPSHLTIPLMFSFRPRCPPDRPLFLPTPGCVPCLHHRPSSPSSSLLPVLTAQFLYVGGGTVLHKSRMLMQQKAVEHYVEWTNFRSAWPRFIRAHKPKVSCVR